MSPDLTRLRIALFGFFVSATIVLIAIHHALTVPANPLRGIRANQALEKWVPPGLVRAKRKGLPTSHRVVVPRADQDAHEISGSQTTTTRPQLPKVGRLIPKRTEAPVRAAAPVSNIRGHDPTGPAGASSTPRAAAAERLET